MLKCGKLEKDGVRADIRAGACGSLLDTGLASPLGAGAAGFTAGEHPRGMEMAAGAATVGLAALAAQEVEGACDHGLVALESAEGGTRAGRSRKR